MEVRNCKSCGRLYNYIGGSYRNLCPDCINKIEDKFIEVKDYIQDHKNATMPEISSECDVRIEQIEHWIREERLYFSDDSPIGIACESCGVTIKSGRFCPACKTKMSNVLSDLYSDDSKNRKSEVKRDSERMRLLSKEFIDKVKKENGK
jgi:flagellar operon protein (TIGR03826 family)